MGLEGGQQEAGPTAEERYICMRQMSGRSSAMVVHV